MKYLMLRESAVLLMLAASSVSDLRSKSIQILPVILGGAVGIMFTLLTKETGPSWWAGFAPGAFFLGMSLVTKGGIGLGDSLVLLALGTWLPWDLLLSSLFCALLASSVVAAWLLITRRSRKNRELPFIPFLLGGVLFCVLSGGR